MEALKSLQKFLKEVRSELKKVAWPGKNEVIVNTTAVIVVSIICGLYIGLVDYAFRKILLNIF
ncbi:MAG: preprotein translocase subunit SecE [Candidatus Wallbacteria bacterium HGW-Wallbacteria-1]|jgi:preprotein translocase subunit SecE|uniref:Protein translocase subunit SecE n=1 Tax=Candidatus Wallbacteria bacterium HGW-Wallbacteria-1 TaxID=2013854 RepID=A0A2N1PSY1_9BACT|nr:MAG: preprotein translocase subunit SecE [Candidatus Wallbacteria bacterium HGW-Wallbacteria-1]